MVVVVSVLRLFPSVPAEIKTAIDDDVLPSGVAVAAGDAVVWSLVSMGRNKKLWGDDAFIFDPTRWLEKRGADCRFFWFAASSDRFRVRSCICRREQDVVCVSGVPVWPTHVPGQADGAAGSEKLRDHAGARRAVVPNERAARRLARLATLHTRAGGTAHQRRVRNDAF